MSIQPVQIGDCTLYHGNALDVLPELEPLSVGALICDPPYSSGGQFRGDRNQNPSTKYVQSGAGETCRDEFAGDNRDQRAFLAWATMWFGHALRAAVPGAVACVFTDWRQLPTMTDAAQCGGWVWRNLVTWWKPGCRMQRGRFSASAEYVVYASHGVPTPGEHSPQNVLVSQGVDGDEKIHIAEKPIELLLTIVGVTPPGAVILDPFMGSGTTAEACIKTGRPFVGIEIEGRHFDNACKRIERAYADAGLFTGAVA